MAGRLGGERWISEICGVLLGKACWGYMGWGLRDVCCRNWCLCVAESMAEGGICFGVLEGLGGHCGEALSSVVDDLGVWDGG
eukprot:165591-Ditylum_brightwellii.AAC.1